MNNVNLYGRFTRDPEVRIADSGTSLARFSLAVDRRFKQENGPQADFIGCIAFGKTAEFIEKYFKKGDAMWLVGRIQTGSYDKDGAKVYTTDIVVDHVGFGGKANNSTGGFSNRPDPSQATGDGFMNIPDGIDEELPFN